MTKKTTTKKSKHDINNTCDTARDTERVIPNIGQSGGLPHKDTLSWNTTYKWCGIQDGGSIQSDSCKERIDELKRHSAMLGRIACYVAEFCDEDDTTLTGVIKIVAKLKEYETQDLWDSYYEERDNQ
jgi:hypothetical protein